MGGHQVSLHERHAKNGDLDMKGKLSSKDRKRGRPENRTPAEKVKPDA